MQVEAEAIVFDKAAYVASLEELKKAIESIDRELSLLAEESGASSEETIGRLQMEKSRLVERIETEKRRIDASETAGKGS